MSFPTFAPGDVLTAADMNAVGLWLIKKQTVGTAVSSVTVTGAFSATYENYRIIMTGGSQSSASGARYNVTLGSTATGYYWTINTSSTAAAAAQYAGANATSVPLGAAYTPTLNAEIMHPFLAKETQFIINFFREPSTNNFGRGVGILDNTTSYTDFTITPSTGTLTGGTIYVYGYKI